MDQSGISRYSNEVSCHAKTLSDSLQLPVRYSHWKDAFVVSTECGEVFTAFGSKDLRQELTNQVEMVREQISALEDSALSREYAVPNVTDVELVKVQELLYGMYPRQEVLHSRTMQELVKVQELNQDYLAWIDETVCLVKSLNLSA